MKRNNRFIFYLCYGLSLNFLAIGKGQTDSRPLESIFGLKNETVMTTDGRTISLRINGTYSFITKKNLQGYTPVKPIDLQPETGAKRWDKKKVQVRLRAVPKSMGGGQPYFFSEYSFQGLTEHRGIHLELKTKDLAPAIKSRLLQCKYANCFDVTVYGVIEVIPGVNTISGGYGVGGVNSWKPDQVFLNMDHIVFHRKP